jgi:hypothetical protein
MTQLLKVEGNASLVRDVSSNAIVNTNVSEYNDYMITKQVAMARVERVNQQTEDINNLKQDVTEIKEMLTMLIKGKE